MKERKKKKIPINNLSNRLKIFLFPAINFLHLQEDNENGKEKEAKEMDRTFFVHLFFDIFRNLRSNCI